ncbi:Peptide methionine sulfoxide reductase MsrA [Planctomycetes bacterium Poly30]|uniref:peptide-methionine (S)-S-oxide reductase n=1 Tax=Saltatorellus ferox TaxID=2528018 RepID=A0A518EMW8_9BACT|nr:Peptide methionine sulfoxide reductase MsrA [Planctomycetes bacterium Poly30]
MLRTRVGYAGGTTPDPTYHSIGDHAEAIDIDFYPTVTRYEELVAVFFRSHNPCREAWSTQYRSAVFPRSKEQREAAEAEAARVARKSGGAIETGIEDFSGFTLAEDYHQKYRLRHVPRALAEFKKQFPSEEAFLGSVAVTRANAFAGGYGRTEQIRDDLGRLGLSEEGQEALRRAAR